LKGRADRNGKQIEAHKVQEQTFASPVVSKSSTERLLESARPILKIAYELAICAFGEPYINDQSAGALRSAILGTELNSHAEITLFPSVSYFRQWEVPSYCHLASLATSGSVLHATIRIFNVIEARVLLSETPRRYPSTQSFWV